MFDHFEAPVVMGGARITTAGGSRRRQRLAGLRVLVPAAGPSCSSYPELATTVVRVEYKYTGDGDLMVVVWIFDARMVHFWKRINYFYVIGSHIVRNRIISRDPLI